MTATSLEIPPASVGTQIVVAILIALLTAFAVQFLLTNLGLAIGISLLKYRPQATQPSQAESSGTTLNISLFAGLGILLTLNSVLFIACFLAVRFSTARDPVSGATLGIAIWSTYFLILIWVSYSTFSYLTGWLFGSVATKLRQLIDAIASSIPETEESASELLTEEAAANLIQQEIKTALKQFDLQQRIDDYLKTVPSLQLDLSAISQGFADLIAKLNLESVAETNLLQKIDRQTFIALLDERTNLSTSETQKIVERLENVWQQAVAHSGNRDLNAELLHFLQSANPEELQFEQLVKRLEKLVDKKSEITSRDLDTPPHQVDEVEMDDHPSSAIKRWSSTLDWKAIKNALLKRVDLSDIELEDVWHTLQSVYQQINSEPESQPAFNTIKNDVEDYLWHAPSWYLHCEKGWQEFKEVIYDPQAAVVQVRSQLEQLQPKDFIALLQQRDDLDSANIKQIAEHLEKVRQEVFSQIESAELRSQKQKLSDLQSRSLRDRLKNFLQTGERIELQGNNLPLRIEQLLIESGVTIEVLTQFLHSWQQLAGQTWLQQRQDLKPEELEQITEQLELIGDRLREKVQDWQIQITSTSQELQHKLELYLRYTNVAHLTPEKIDAKLEQLWQEARDNLPAVQQQLPEIDCSVLMGILERRKGLDIEQVEKIATQIETNWQRANGSLTLESSPLQTKSAELVENLVDDLYQAIEQKVNLADIEESLPQILELAKSETTTRINQELDRLDWNEIEQKLKQVQKGSAIQIQQTIKQLRESIRKLAKLPRRWATRTSQQVENVVDELEDFLKYSNKIDFTSENLERNLKSIFHYLQIRSPSNRDYLADNLDRLANLTPANITKSLAERKDISPVEREQISDRFITITHQLVEKIKTKQEQTNELVQHLLERIGEYLSSLNLFYLDYDQLKTNLASFDFQSLIHSWQETIAEIPLEQLGDRLGQLSYETLVQIMQTNELLYDSTWQQIQGLQDYIAQQIEDMKITAYERTETLKQQTLQQVEATRKAIASAAYWMFAITFTSAVTSALAGFLATLV